MIDSPIETTIPVDVQDVVLNTDGESVTTVYAGIDGGIYSCQIPTDVIPVADPTSQEAITFLSTYVVEG